MSNSKSLQPVSSQNVEIVDIVDFANAERVKLYLSSGTPLISSLEVAKHLDVQHFRVMKIISNMIDLFGQQLSNLCTCAQVKTQSTLNRQFDCYLLDKNALLLLCGHLRSDTALKVSIKIIEAFEKQKSAVEVSIGMIKTLTADLNKLKEGIKVRDELIKEFRKNKELAAPYRKPVSKRTYVAKLDTEGEIKLSLAQKEGTTEFERRLGKIKLYTNLQLSYYARTASEMDCIKQTDPQAYEALLPTFLDATQKIHRALAMEQELIEHLRDQDEDLELPALVNRQALH